MKLGLALRRRLIHGNLAGGLLYGSKMMCTFWRWREWEWGDADRRRIIVSHSAVCAEDSRGRKRGVYGWNEAFVCLRGRRLEKREDPCDIGRDHRVVYQSRGGLLTH